MSKSVNILVFKGQNYGFEVQNVSKFWFGGCQVNIFQFLGKITVIILVFKVKMCQNFGF